MSKTYRHGIVAIAFAIASLVGTTAYADNVKLVKPESVGFSSERLAKLKPAMQAHIDSGKLAGIVTMVARHGKIVNFDTLGYRDAAAKSPMRKDTIFRLASMTKPILGVALMVLYEEGQWQLDDPIAKFIPEFAHMKVLTAKGELVDANRSPTMREVLTNTGGIAGGPRNPKVTKMYTDMDRWNLTLAEMVAKVTKLPLAFQPGTEFDYGISQDVLAHVIERISGLPFDVFLRQRLFKPLGMKDTDFHVPADKRARLAAAYQYDRSGVLVLAAPDSAIGQRTGDKPKYLSGAGGLYGTAEDYMRFAQMLMNGGVLDGVRILSPLTVNLMTSDLLPPGVPQHFSQDKLAGLGWGGEVGVVLDPGRATFSGGLMGEGSYYWFGAFGTWWHNDPTNDVVVMGFIQQDWAALAYVGLPHPTPDLRAQSASLVYSALTDLGK